jgi:hypothetical protein
MLSSDLHFLKIRDDDIGRKRGNNGIIPCDIEQNAFVLRDDPYLIGSNSHGTLTEDGPASVPFPDDIIQLFNEQHGTRNDTPVYAMFQQKLLHLSLHIDNLLRFIGKVKKIAIVVPRDP